MSNISKKLRGWALAVVSASAFLAAAVQATPITFYNDAATPATPRFTVGCGSSDGSCVGLFEAVNGITPSVTWSSTVGQMLAGPSSANPASETAYVNSLLGIDLTANSGNMPPVGNNTFQMLLIDTNYLLLKVGNGPANLAYALLHNLAGEQGLWFNQAGPAGGLSHYITFNADGTPPPTPVPEPGVLGMFGVGLLLVGTGYGLRRRRSA